MHDYKIRTLLIEDDDVDAKGFERVLRQTSINVGCQHVNTIKDGILSIQNDSHDIIFVDYHMPLGNPYEVLSFIRENKIKTPVVIITSHADPQIAVDLIKSGATDYIPKTLLNQDGLAQCIRSALRLKELKDKKLQTEQRLKNVEGRLSTIISSTPIILFVTSDNGDIQLGLGKFWESFSPKGENIIGENIYNVFADYPSFIKAFGLAIEGRFQVFKIKINNIIFEITLTPKLAENGNVYEVLGLALNVTNHEEGKRKLEEAKILAEKASQMKQEFISNMSHEIRTPMNAITGFADLLSETDLDEFQADFVKSIKTSGENLLTLINDILDFSKIESGKMDLVKVPFDLKKILSAVVDVLKVKAKERGNELKVELNTEYNFFKGDSARIYQVLINLVNNAIKFTKHGSIVIKVDSVEERITGAILRFVIQDNGLGIPEDKLVDIFESFVQVDGGVARKVGGTGLGLAIVRRIISLMDGEVEVKSTVDVGSEFTIKLPLEFATEGDLTDDLKTEDWETALAGKRFLLVEDNEMNQKLVIMYLRRFKLSIDLAENGEQAVKAVQSNDYDLVLMDVQMPIMDGIEATKQIRALNNEKCKVPIVAMTAHAFKEEVERCFDAGMNAHISKPIEKNNFFNVISSLVVAKKVNSEVKEFSTEVTVIKPVDLSYLREMSGGNLDFIKEMVAIFKKDSPILIGEMKQYFEAESWDLLKKIAHKYRSPAVMMGMKAIADLAGEVEYFDYENGERKKVLEMLNKIQSSSNLAVQYIENNFYA